jgi:uncharacterized membrane protein YidH (DUF202 family)
MDKQEKYEQRLQFEHELINRRLTWLLTSQSILFAALAFVLEKERMDPLQKEFSKIISVLGISIALAILIGVIMGIAAKILTWQDSKKAGAKHFGVRTWITFTAFIPDVFMPIAFAVAWYCIVRAIA